MYELHWQKTHIIKVIKCLHFLRGISRLLLSVVPRCQSSQRSHHSPGTSLKYIPRRAVLYVPGNDERKLQKLTSLDVDCAVLDCEDGVALNKKVPTALTSHSSSSTWLCRAQSQNPHHLKLSFSQVLILNHSKESYLSAMLKTSTFPSHYVPIKAKMPPYHIHLKQGAHFTLSKQQDFSRCCRLKAFSTRPHSQPIGPVYLSMKSWLEQELKGEPVEKSQLTKVFKSC